MEIGEGAEDEIDLPGNLEGHAPSWPDRFGMRPGFDLGALPQGNMGSMNGRKGWRWGALGDPGHGDACPSSIKPWHEYLTRSREGAKEETRGGDLLNSGWAA